MSVNTFLLKAQGEALDIYLVWLAIFKAIRFAAKCQISAKYL